MGTAFLSTANKMSYIFAVSIVCAIVAGGEARHGYHMKNIKRHWWGQNGECMTQVDFNGLPQNGGGPAELVVTFSSELVAIRAHGDMFTINGETGDNGRFDMPGTEYTITKKDRKLQNEFPNVSLKAIVSIDAGSHCWEVELPDLEYTWTYTDDEQTCSGTQEDANDVRNADCGSTSESGSESASESASASESSSESASESASESESESLPSPPLPPPEPDTSRRNDEYRSMLVQLRRLL